jgi:ribonuclease-3
MELTRASIEEILGTKINDLSLYQRAFTHKSKLKEDPTKQSFETLEFIGDSCLGFVVTKFLFDRFEEKQEGFLTKARTKLVRHETLSDISKKLGLYRFVQMDAKGMSNGWFMNPGGRVRSPRGCPVPRPRSPAREGVRPQGVQQPATGEPVNHIQRR